MSELVWGIKNGDLDQVKDIVEKSSVDVNKEIEGRNPIHYAADYGQYDVINYLISKGADVNAKDKHGISALLAAIWEGHTNCVRLLIEKGAEKCGKTPDGSSYLDVAEKEEIRLLLQKIFAPSDKTCNAIRTPQPFPLQISTPVIGNGLNTRYVIGEGLGDMQKGETEGPLLYWEALSDLTNPATLTKKRIK